MFLKQCQILGAARGIDHDNETICVARDHEIIDQTARLIGKETIALAAFCEACNLNGRDPLKCRSLI